MPSGYASAPVYAPALYLNLREGSRAPVRGLYFVGTDAGGTGVGTQQAIASGMNVADLVWRYDQMKKANG